MAWFLEHFYRLDEVATRDALCDSPNDKGIDGIYVDKNRNEVHFFQSKLRQSGRVKGEGELKNLAGSVAQFSTPERVQSILDGGANKELKSRLLESDVKGLIASGYRPVGVYLTNNPVDANAHAYAEANDDIVVYDAEAISQAYVQVDQSEGIEGTFKFDLDHAPIEYSAGKTAKMYLAIVPATDLVKLSGIKDQALFERNVRRDLGLTPVNKSIAKSVSEVGEHDKFPLFHNGITLLAETVDMDEDSLAVSNYMVVNGAQSLSTFEKKSKDISEDLKILLRVVEVGKNEALIDQITTRSNNQNAIKPRDRRSNDSIQTRLQAEMASLYGGEYVFVIKRGYKAPSGVTVINNDDAGRLLLAFDRKEPWGSHQIYRIFDDEHNRIFARREVDAHRIVFLYELDQIIRNNLDEIQDGKVRSYALTRYFILYVVRLILELTEEGESLIQQPQKFIGEEYWDRLCEFLDDLVSDIVVDFDAEIDEEEEGFDYKTVLKSESGVKRLGKKLVNVYRKELRKGRAPDLASSLHDEEDE